MAESLAHTKWLCKYHLVFTPKYRRKIIYHQLRADLQTIIKDLCKWKGIEIIEGHMMSGSCTSVGIRSPEVFHFVNNGVSEGDVFDDDL